MPFNTDWNRVHDEVDWRPEPDLCFTEFIAKHYKAGENRTFLDIGCGVGACAVPLALAGFKVIAIDGAPAAVRALKVNLLDSGCNVRNVTCVTGDILDLDLEPQSLDCIIDAVTFSMMPLEDVRFVLEKATRWLKPDGRIYSKQLVTLPPPRFNRTYARTSTPAETKDLFRRFVGEAFTATQWLRTGEDEVSPIEHVVFDAQLAQPQRT